MRAFPLILACVGSALILGCQERPPAKPNASETEKTNSETMMTHREKLISKIEAQSSPGEFQEIVVSLDDFFVGNNDPASIGVNLGPDQPPIAEFHRVLGEIRAKPDVQDVLVRIYEYEDPTSWPYTDTIYIISSAPVETIKEWVSPLLPDEIYADWMYGKPPAAPEVKPGMTAYSVWWD